MESLQARFLPEFLNRIDEIIVFRPLDRSQIRKIVDLQVERLAKLLDERDFGLEVTDAARDEIANRGYDPAFGARPLKRVIQQELQNPLATELLKGEFPKAARSASTTTARTSRSTAIGGGNGAPRKGEKVTRRRDSCRRKWCNRNARHGQLVSCVIGDHRSSHPLPIHRRQAPIGDHDFRAGRHVADLAGDFDLLALGGLGQALLEMREFLAALAAALDFFLAFADGHEEEVGVSGLGMNRPEPVRFRTTLCSSGRHAASTRRKSRCRAA